MGLPAEEQNLGQYVIDEKIAQGGMAEIFLGRAVDPNGLERPVVIKRILPHIAASDEFVEMLVQEAKLTVQLSHGNIAQVYDLGKIGDDYFIVMEFVDGESLSRIARFLRQQDLNMPVPIALYIVSEVANGLDYMHRKTDASGQLLHIVHRDISPQNLIISRSGTVKIIDFGIAKAATHLATTDSGVVKGKFAYMSPEHVAGERLDARTDIFSLGVILWELLTNQRLFKGKNNKETIQRVKRCRVPAASGYRKDIPKDVEKILKKALAKNKNHRYAAAHDFLLDLIRTLVQHFPQFAPKDLQDYMQQLFPDQLGEEPTVISERQPESHEEATILEEKEATVLADPAIFRERLRELETYLIVEEPAEDIAATPPEKASAEPDQEAQAEEAKQAPPPVTKKASPLLQALSRIPWRRIMSLVPTVFRTTLLLAVLAGLSYGGLKGFAWVQEWWSEGKSAPPTEEVETVEPKPLPPPEPKVPSPTVLPGTLNLTSTPAGAAIFLNDVDTGKRTPARFEKLDPKQSYRLGLFRDDYQYWEQKLVVPAGKNFPLHAELKLNYGSLQISSLPPGSEVWLNGKKVGRTPFQLSELKPGALYQIRILRPGFRPWTGSAKIFAGKAAVISAVLKKP